jgi:hypothetical protein
MKIEHQTPNLVLDPAGSWSCLPCLIIRLIIQTIRRDPSGSDQVDEASNLSRPDPSGAAPGRRRASGCGSGGWFLYSLPAHVPAVLGSERRLVEEGRNGLEQTMDAIARGVEIIGIVTLVLAWRRPSSAPRWA